MLMKMIRHDKIMRKIKLMIMIMLMMKKVETKMRKMMLRLKMMMTMKDLHQITFPRVVVTLLRD